MSAHMISVPLAVAQAAPDGGLTLHQILQSLPSDPASLFTIFLLLFFMAFVLWAGVRSGRKGDPAA